MWSIWFRETGLVYLNIPILIEDFLTFASKSSIGPSYAACGPYTPFTLQVRTLPNTSRTLRNTSRSLRHMPRTSVQTNNVWNLKSEPWTTRPRNLYPLTLSEIWNLNLEQRDHQTCTNLKGPPPLREGPKYFTNVKHRITKCKTLQGSLPACLSKYHGGSKKSGCVTWKVLYMDLVMATLGF